MPVTYVTQLVTPASGQAAKYNPSGSINFYSTAGLLIQAGVPDAYSVTFSGGGGGGGLAYGFVTSSPVTMVIGHGYINNIAVPLPSVLNLPGSPSAFDVVAAVGRLGKWSILTGSQIVRCPIWTTTAPFGSITSTTSSDSIALICVNAAGAASEWTVLYMVGQLDFK